MYLALQTVIEQKLPRMVWLWPFLPQGKLRSSQIHPPREPESPVGLGSGLEGRNFIEHGKSIIVIQSQLSILLSCDVCIL